MEKIKTIVKSTIDLAKEKVISHEKINSLINFFTNDDNDDNNNDNNDDNNDNNIHYDDSYIGDLKRIEETWGWFVDPEYVVKNRNNTTNYYSEKEKRDIEKAYFDDIDNN